ncbi:MAG TPA: RES family NAD+ phosphorylase [Salinimicrobium sp.]|nr:RES family NAD+ phosphorylase [Salinimicrobium sp.]
MIVYRLARKRHQLKLSGKGAAIQGGRWNSKGVEIIYTAKSRALAMAEVAVHLSLATLPTDFVMMEIEIPKHLKPLKLNSNKLPSNWNAWPYSQNTQKFGDDFIKGNTACILEVPSAVVSGDFNILVNPSHPKFKSIKIVKMDDFPFDKRIFE